LYFFTTDIIMFLYICCVLPLVSGEHICYEQGFSSSVNAGQSKECNLISLSN